MVQKMAVTSPIPVMVNTVMTEWCSCRYSPILFIMWISLSRHVELGIVFKCGSWGLEPKQHSTSAS